MQIGELAERCGVSVRMLRYYEAEGLLNPARTPSGYRDFDAGDVETVRRIVMLNRAGLTLSTIRTLLPCAREGGDGFEPCAAFKASLSAKLQDLDRQIEALQGSRQLVATYLAEAEKD
ncbi:MerR family transcriptional regulator [Kordiimonas marina]|uniref:MerR family transcriptional regulator n=1 Tax=Kordiimonas marina TaxID=2872312 RepID=UPI001FF261F5|nr:MerR family transcriptional regulator [Kordiimonas marina]MCJ9430088.1 MerR family transcriptional regulator [Kordiimonas marina]